MDLLDNDILSGKLEGLDRVKKMAEIKDAYTRMSSNIKQARVVLWIITVISFISLMFSMSMLETMDILYSIIAIIIFIVAAVVPFKHVKYAFFPAVLIYGFSLLISFASFTNGLFILSLVIKSVVLYFIIRGLISSFHYTKITDEMKMYNMDIPE